VGLISGFNVTSHVDLRGRGVGLVKNKGENAAGASGFRLDWPPNLSLKRLGAFWGVDFLKAS